MYLIYGAVFGAGLVMVASFVIVSTLYFLRRVKLRDATGEAVPNLGTYIILGGLYVLSVAGMTAMIVMPIYVMLSRERTTDIAQLRQSVQQSTQRNELLGRRLDLFANTIGQSTIQMKSFVFVGHVYPFNGNTAPDYYREFPSYGGPQDTIRTFLSFTNQVEPERVIFGGDSVSRPDERGYRYFLDSVQSQMNSQARFLLGNHDTNSSIDENSPLFKQMYQDGFGYEDIDGVRLVYLRSSESGLSEQQIDFMVGALDNSYESALVFLHHGLWLASEVEPIVNSPYEGLAENYWVENILPILTDSRVRGVFAGDGGVRHSTVGSQLCGIPHYLTGWSFDLRKRPADFLRIFVDREKIDVWRYEIMDEESYRVGIEMYNPVGMVECSDVE